MAASGEMTLAQIIVTLIIALLVNNIVTIIYLVIYFIFKHKKNSSSEIDKMNIKDL